MAEGLHAQRSRRSSLLLNADGARRCLILAAHAAKSTAKIHAPLSWEERFDLKRKRMTLRKAADHYLPEHMVLLTDEPVQAVFKGLVQRIFSLGFINEYAHLQFHHAEYLLNVPEDIQLKWAIEEFQRAMQVAQA